MGEGGAARAEGGRKDGGGVSSGGGRERSWVREGRRRGKEVNGRGKVIAWWCGGAMKVSQLKGGGGDRGGLDDIGGGEGRIRV